MACCAAAAYIVWRLVSLHDSLFGLTRDASEEVEANDYDRDKGIQSIAGGRILPQNGPQQTKLATHNPPQTDSRNRDVRNTLTCLLSLDGITCGACVQQIETALRQQKGVRAAHVSLVLHRARVTYDSALASPHDLIRTVQDSGYVAREVYPAATGQGGTVSNIKTALDESEATWALGLARLRGEFAASVLASAILVGTGQLGSWLAAARLLVSVRLLAVAACFFLSRHIHLRAVRSLVPGRRRTVDTLTSVGMIAALMQSLLPSLGGLVGRPARAGLTAELADSSSSLESIGMLCTIVLGGRLLKAVASRRPLSQAGRLARLFPRMAYPVTRDGTLDEDDTPAPVPADLLQPGDSVLVQAGEHVPADGLVTSGSSGRVENSWMTGDEKPRGVLQGDRVHAGSRLLHGRVVVMVEKSGVKTKLGEVLACISASDQSPRDATADTQTGNFVDAILLIVLLTGTIWWLLGTSWPDCLQRMVSMLVCACPCTLELSVPISLLSAAASAARSNIRISAQRDRLASAASVRTILFDKTGTLTTGRLNVSEQILTPEWSCSSDKSLDWWSIVSAVEAHAMEHPVARAIRQEAAAQLASSAACAGRQVKVKTAEYLPGNGVQAWVSLDSGPPVHVAIGSRRFVSWLSIEPDLSLVPEDARSAIATIVVVAIDHRHAGVLVCRDAIRPSAQPAIQSLSRLGIRVKMVTGDSWDAAALVARSVGIRREDVRAEMLPLDKAKAVRAERRRGPVVVVGDNLNDAPAFCESSFGVYVGSGTAGTDAALLPKTTGLALDPEQAERGGVVSAEATGSLTEEHIDLGQLESIIRLARRTTSRINQNTLLSYAYNLMALTVASGALQSVDARLVLTPTMASLGMGLNSALVLWNGLRVED